MTLVQKIASTVSNRTMDWLAACALCLVMGYSACWIQQHVPTVERQKDVLTFANANWNRVYNDLQRACVPDD